MDTIRYFYILLMNNAVGEHWQCRRSVLWIQKHAIVVSMLIFLWIVMISSSFAFTVTVDSVFQRTDGSKLFDIERLDDWMINFCNAELLRVFDEMVLLKK